MLLIKNGHIKPIVGQELECGSILIDDGGKIAAIGENIAVTEDISVIDADGRLVTPGCVEAHCHLGMHTAAMRWEGTEYNEKSDPITPHMRAIDGFNPQDTNLPLALAGGVTTVCTGPGSANLIGGTFVVVKLGGDCIDDMILKYPAAMKCAFGENPKSVYGQNKKAPVTRMGVAAMLREFLFKAKAYAEEKDAGKDPKFDIKLEAMLPVMRGEIPLKCHAHRADDILTSVRIVQEFGLKMTLDHCTDGSIIADKLGKTGFPAFVGPTFGSKSKPELSTKSFDTPNDLYNAGVPVSIITDSDVIPQEYLPMCAGLAANAGLPMEEAWRAITINPATALGVADRIGSLEVGKDADIVIWDDDPLVTVGGQAYTTIVDGKIVYQA